VTKKEKKYDLVCDQYIVQCLQIGFKLRVNKLGFKPLKLIKPKKLNYKIFPIFYVVETCSKFGCRFQILHYSKI